MKKEQEPANPLNKGGPPTLLEFMASYHAAVDKLTGQKGEENPELEVRPLPQWGVKTLEQLRKTVMRPILKLKPHKNINCKDYGKIVGILDRQITFLEVDIWEILIALGLDKITDEEWEKIQPEAQMRALLIRVLNRKVGDDEMTADLAIEVLELKIKRYKDIKQAGFDFIAQQSAKDRSLFYDGLAIGYKLFLNEAGKFCGDRGRTEIYMDLLASQYEIEKMRRMLPVKNDGNLYDYLKPLHNFPSSVREQNIAWLRDVCDDISLYITGKRGRPVGATKCKSAPSL